MAKKTEKNRGMRGKRRIRLLGIMAKVLFGKRLPICPLPQYYWCQLPPEQWFACGGDPLKCPLSQD